MTFYLVKDGQIIRELPPDKVVIEETEDGLRYILTEEAPYSEAPEPQADSTLSK